MSSDSVKVEITDSEKTSEATTEPANEQFDVENEENQQYHVDNQESQPFKISTEETPAIQIKQNKNDAQQNKNLILNRILSMFRSSITLLNDFNQR